MYQVLRCFERHGYFQRIRCLATFMYCIMHQTNITVVCFVDVPVDIDALKKRMKNAKVSAVFSLGVFGMARRHALISLRHALISLRHALISLRHALISLRHAALSQRHVALFLFFF